MDLKSIATFAIDEKEVEDSPYSWESMFYQQSRIPILLSTLLGFLWYLDDGSVNPLAWYVGILFTVYAIWPAIGAYWYWKIE